MVDLAMVDRGMSTLQIYAGKIAIGETLES
jgi:hypothetical protein